MTEDEKREVTETPMRERLAMILDPLAFGPAESMVGPRGLESASREAIDKLYALRRAGALRKVDKFLAEMEKPSEGVIFAIREDLRVDDLDPTMDEARMAFIAGIRAIREGK